MGKLLNVFTQRNDTILFTLLKGQYSCCRELLVKTQGRKKRDHSGGFVVIQRNNNGSLNKEVQGKERKADTSRQILEKEQIEIATEL